MKLAIYSINPLTFVFLRMFFATVLLSFIIKPYLQKNRILDKHWPTIIVAGLLGITLNIGFFFVGLQKTTVVDSSIISATTSVFTALAAYLFLKEKISKIILIGILISFCGVITIIIQPIMDNGLFKFQNILGNIFILMAVWAWVLYTIVNKEISKKYDCLLLAYISFIIGVITFLPFAIKDIVNINFFLNLTPFLVFAIIFETVFCTILAYFFFTLGVKYVSATVTGVLAYIHPIVAVVCSIMFLNERLTIPFIIGALLVICGLFLTEARHKVHPLHHLHLRK